MKKERSILMSIGVMCLGGNILDAMVNKAGSVIKLILMLTISTIGIVCVKRAGTLLKLEEEQIRKSREDRQNTDNK